MYLCYGKFCTEKHTTNLLAYTRKSGKKGGKEIYQSAWSGNPPNFALGRLSWAADFEVSGSYQNSTIDMEFPPKSWDVFPAEQFDTASPRDPGELGMELLVQMRDNGRIQDHFRIALGGTKLLKALLPMKDIFVVPEDFPDWVIEYGKWPADLIFSRNRTTTVWVDINAMI